MPRFVILEHDHPTRHWDFMLEAGAVLRSWRLESPPDPGKLTAATPSFDHRPIYLDYEGPISGGRGQVQRWDAGSFTWIANEPNRIAVQLEGQHCRGMAVIEAGQFRLE